MVRFLRTSSRHNGFRDTTHLEVLSDRPDGRSRAQRRADKKYQKKAAKQRKISPSSNPLNSPLPKKGK